MKTKTVAPAMTPAEWEAWEAARSARRKSPALPPMKIPPLAGDAHSMAAQLLHGKPFGFTWDDVDALREVMADAQGANLGPLEGLADRIAALLPRVGAARTP